MLFLKNLLFFTSTALAVNVILYIVDDNQSCGPDDPSLICNDIGIGICCVSNQVTDFPSAQVAGLNPDPTQGNVAIAFHQAGNNRCGVACDSAFPGNLACLTCNGGIRGAGWNLLPSAKQSTDSLSACTSSVEPDELRYNGRSYNIFHDVPAEITAQLLDLARNQTNTADIPEHLARYEK